MTANLTPVRGWEEFEPSTPREAVAWALMCSGLAMVETDTAGRDLPGDAVRLDYEAADRLLDDLAHTPSGAWDVRETPEAER